MKDVGDQVLSLQSVPLLRRDASGRVTADPDHLMPWNEVLKFGWTVLDGARPDGLSYSLVKYSEAGIDSPDKKAVAAGKVLVIDRETGPTRLFFVWLPTSLARALEAATLPAPVNFHVLFHPPTYEPNYSRTRPYWAGRHPKEEKDGKPTSDSEKALFIELGIRYLCSDFRAVVHHVMAVTAKDPSMMYVVPVADFPANFSDLIDPDTLQATLRDIYQFIARRLAPQRAPQFDRIGKVMLSAYSRSGDRLTELMTKVGAGHRFFSDHLAQLNAFDINLGNNDDERLPVFRKFWSNIRVWRSKVNPAARAFIYTAYRSHYHVCKDNPISSSHTWNPPTDLNMDEVKWSDEKRKKVRGPMRGMASECYDQDGTLGLLCLPVMFFEFYLMNAGTAVGNSTRGWAAGDYHSGGLHGHGLFLRAMMSHAIAHADPKFFVGPATRK